MTERRCRCVRGSAPITPGSRCMNGRIALKRCVTPRAPRSNAAFACAAVASVCPSEIVTPRSTSRSISAPAPGSSGASVISRTSPASRSRSRSARSGSRRDDAPCAPRRAGERNGPSRCTPRISRPGLAARDLTQRAEQLVLRARDQRRQEGGHARLEQGVAGDAVVGAARVEEVDPAEAVHLQVDEPGDGDPLPHPPGRRRSRPRPSTSTSPGRKEPLTSAAVTPSLTAPVYERPRRWSIPLRPECLKLAALVYTIAPWPRSSSTGRQGVRERACRR